MGIGVPNYVQGDKYPKKNYFTIKDGDNFYRILPPFGSLAEKGTWMVYAATHWLRNEKGQGRPVACIQDKDPKTKMIRVRCPFCDEVERREEMLGELTKTLTGEELAIAIKMQKDWKFQYGRKSGFYMNAKNREGAIGQLEIKTKHKQALMPVVKELSEAGLDPIGMAGVELNFFRSGVGQETTHSVAPAVEKISAVEQRIKVSPLSDEDVKKMETDAFDLVNLFRVLDPAAMKRIVDSDFNGEIVSLVWMAPKNQTGSPDATDEDDDAAGDIPSYKPQGFTPSTPAAAPSQPVVTQQPAAFVQPTVESAKDPVVQQAVAQSVLVSQPATPLVSVATNKQAFMNLFAPKTVQQKV